MNQLPKHSFGLYPTPMQKLEALSARFGRNIWIKRDDLCGIALGGNKVRKLQYLLADAQEKGCDTVFTTGGAQSNHAMLTAACAAQLGMDCVLPLKKRGVTDHKGNLVLDTIYGAHVEQIDTDSYQDIYDLMDEKCKALEANGKKGYAIPVGGSNAFGSCGYVDCVAEIAKDLAGATIGHIVSATGSGGTTAGLLVGAKCYLPDVKVTGLGVDDDDFDTIAPQLAEEAAKILGVAFPRHDGDFQMVYHFGTGYAIPNPEDTPIMDELAKSTGILLDPVYTGKAYAGFVKLLEENYFEGEGDIVFVHTGGAAALFALERV
ncbi:D-cysteine desulfhydrase family protein [Bengtsoniella intestinalis]|uniref:1-aminocyclopropane-1-carboxylate deaminase/D-cysteine desulfhydrase n=1 Tax=Bengtsoniella intestinalis TaxID=3073143 RepID=UPI00391F9E71